MDRIKYDPPKPEVSLLFDSGAFSAYNLGQPVDINKYADFVLANQRHLRTAVNLDVINPKNTVLAGKQSLDNFLFLKNKRGLLTLPVFHCGEPFSYLETMMRETDYIGLSTSMTSNQEGLAWYDIIWPRVTDMEGYPLAKFHAFGDAVPETIISYPWYSADSTTWFIAAGRAGRMFVNGKYVQFRTKTDKAENVISDSDTGYKREVWEEAFNRNGLNPKICIEADLRSSDIMLIRTLMNACYFLELQEKSRDCIACRATPSIVFPKKQLTGGTPAVGPLNFHFVFTGSTATRSLAVLSQLKIKHVLLSYFYTDLKQWDELILPWLYDPIGTCKTHPGLKKQCEILAGFLNNPIIV